jgi:uncharacterized SAM-dependent methyltransferase
MSSPVQATVHPSQFPDQVMQDLLTSLRQRQVNHKFHYDSFKQAERWLAVHQAYAPLNTQADCASAYGRSFQGVSTRITGPRVHLVSLGCGSGQKDADLLACVRATGREIFYTPVDVSLALVLRAVQTAESIVPRSHCFPLVCDLASAEDLPEIVAAPYGRSGSYGDLTSAAGRTNMPERLLAFFGMMPNFEPSLILPKLASLLRPGDHLLLSANLAPGLDYDAGLNRILPQYDNVLTREWLLTFLLDLGVERGDGELRYTLEQSAEAGGVKRVTVYFDFLKPRSLQVGDESLAFVPNDSIRLFFSYRHTPALINAMLGRYGIKVLDQWLSSTEEEGIFLAIR